MWSQNSLSNWLHDAITSNTGLLSIKLWYKSYNINKQDKDGNTPLHLALIHNRQDVAQFLLEHGANLLIKNNDQKTSHDVAVDKRYNELATYIDKIQEARNQELIKASQEKNTKKATQALLKGANINYVDKQNYTPLNYACETADSNSLLGYGLYFPTCDFIKFLIKKGASIKSCPIPPLYTLCYNDGCDEANIAKLLIDHGADVKKIYNKKTILKICNVQCTKIITLLLSSGAPTNPAEYPLAPLNKHHFTLYFKSINTFNTFHEYKKNNNEIQYSLHQEPCKAIKNGIPQNFCSLKNHQLIIKRLIAQENPQLFQACVVTPYEQQKWIEYFEHASLINTTSSAALLLTFITPHTVENLQQFAKEGLPKISDHKRATYNKIIRAALITRKLYELQQAHSFTNLTIEHKQ